jgi:hypothetical protein
LKVLVQEWVRVVELVVLVLEEQELEQALVQRGLELERVQVQQVQQVQQELEQELQLQELQ